MTLSRNLSRNKSITPSFVAVPSLFADDDFVATYINPLGQSVLGGGFCRVVQFGTSIATGSAAVNRVFAKQLQEIWGSCVNTEYRAGALGGSWTDPYNGWYKQPYGGLNFTRARGDSVSTEFHLTETARYVDVYYSTETNGGSFDVEIDDVVASTVNCSGAQSYGNKITIDCGSLGSHKVSMVPPASGYAYLERVVFRESDSGVDVLDGTLGGSMHANAVYLRGAGGGQVAGIAISGNAGIAGLWNQSYADLVICSFTVNDAGGTYWDEFGTHMTTGLDYAAALNIPVILIVEMAGSYSLPNYSKYSEYNSVKAATLGFADSHDNVLVVDWDSLTRNDADLAQYAADYYSGVSNLDVDAATWSGDFIHPDSNAHPYGVNRLCDQCSLPRPVAYDVNSF